MVTKVERVMTERQRYWLEHVRAADASDDSTVAYAHAQGLKVKDLYQWKTQLIKLGFYPASDSPSGFVPVKSIVPVVANAAKGLAPCALVFPSGLRFEFDESISPDVIRAVIASASESG
ncbi:MAG: hypothetical protein OER96_12580 [Gammaproteobacteria bacterium]|nr:hypothetical protein [Gammaproteobacteria bacterium]